MQPKSTVQTFMMPLRSGVFGAGPAGGIAVVGQWLGATLSTPDSRKRRRAGRGVGSTGSAPQGLAMARGSLATARAAGPVRERLARSRGETA